MIKKWFLCIGLLLLALNAQAQVANDRATRQAIISALPAGVTAKTATADQIAQACIDLVFSLEVEVGVKGDRDTKVTQIMVSLEELTREGTFENAPRFGHRNPPGRFYDRMLSLASSALDVTYTTYHGVTVQHIMALTAAMRKGQNFVNGAQSQAITRK